MLIEIEFLDDSQTVLATASVDARGDIYSGTIDLRPMPINVLRIFEDYEEIVNSQSLSVLDRIEDEIGGLRILARFGGDVFKVKDLQIFPGAGTVHFKTVREPIRVG